MGTAIIITIGLFGWGLFLCTLVGIIRKFQKGVPRSYRTWGLLILSLFLALAPHVFANIIIGIFQGLRLVPEQITLPPYEFSIFSGPIGIIVFSVSLLLALVALFFVWRASKTQGKPFLQYSMELIGKGDDYQQAKEEREFATTNPSDQKERQ